MCSKRCLKTSIYEYTNQQIHKFEKVRPVKYNENSKVQLAEIPDGYWGEGFMTTMFDKAIGLARANSMWPLPFATSCCGIEFMATMGATYDLARFGSERMAFTPRQCDMLLVAGTISKKLAPVLRQVYLQMAEPRWVIAIGACASSGGIFDSYSVLQGIDQVIPVDVYVPGCPPRPEGILDGVMKLQEIVKNESLRRRHSDRYKALLNEYGIQ